ncbi:RsmB/NOP family class I SAM-dependent RNA methyltransferase [Spongisporangium articulatum]|uniref:RsmB/NOP family class I SAM-dependent RNA methyltransferase n=1 Tax=Spongisporangium articulatum TaxID=3362603 RepID=A0ABW8ARA5_9ACTN
MTQARQKRPNPPRGGGRAGAAARVTGAREVAYEVITAVRERDAYANLLLPTAIRRARLSARDAALATELTYGTLRGQGRYDAVIAACIDRPLDDVDPGLLDALRMGAHQVLATRIGAHAAVSTSVDLVRLHAGQGSARFANAVLRRVAEKDLDTWLGEVAPDAVSDPDGHLAVVHSHPAWVVRALRDALVTHGRPAAELPDLLAADNDRPTVSAVALPGLSTPEELRAEGGAGPGRWSPYAVTVHGSPEGLPAIGAGRARVQDEGSQVVTLALTAAAVEGDDTGAWLDLCAGPGGKAALLGAVLAQEQPDGELVAVESQPHRAGLVEQALAAVPVTHEVLTADGRQIPDSDKDCYDRVLVDAPCSGLGALRRRPEARWRRSPGDLPGLTGLQRDLLDAGLDAVRPGGVLAYVTCSPHPAETAVVVADVLRKRADVVQLDAREAVATATGRPVAELDLGAGPAVQLWPHRHGTDAMYLALLRKGG